MISPLVNNQNVAILALNTGIACRSLADSTTAAGTASACATRLYGARKRSSTSAAGAGDVGVAARLAAEEIDVQATAAATRTRSSNHIHGRSDGATRAACARCGGTRALPGGTARRT